MKLAGSETTGDCSHENPERWQGRKIRIGYTALLPEHGIMNWQSPVVSLPANYRRAPGAFEFTNGSPTVKGIA